MSKTLNEEHGDETVGDDGLTDREREFIKTPFSQLSPDSIRFGMAVLEKRAEHNWKENEEFKRNKQTERNEREEAERAEELERRAKQENHVSTS